jgi:hypothetical protein
METLGPFIAAILTLMVFSYIFGDNALFKLATHIFVGVAVGYAIIIIWHQVFLPTVTAGNLITALPALILCLFLILKIPAGQGNTFSALGNITLAFVLGIGAALALGGALFGTLIPQVAAMTGISLNPNHYPNTQQEVGLVIWLNNIIIVLGTIGTFFYFTFTVRSKGFFGGLREGFVRFWAGMGRLMIIFTLGALFANTVSARVALLISRIQFLTGLLGG